MAEKCPLSQGSSGAGSGQTRTSFDKDLKYPIDIGNGSQDVIKFDMLKYEPKKAQVQVKLVLAIVHQQIVELLDLVSYPSQQAFKMQVSVGFADDNMNAFQAALAAASMTG